VEVTYRNTLLDMMRFRVHAMPRQRGFQFVFVISAIVIGYTFWSSIRRLDATSLEKVVVFTVLLSGFLLLLSLVTLSASFLSLLVDHKRRVGIDYTLSFDDSGVVEISKNERIETSWAGISKVVRTRQLFFLFIGPCRAYVIPKRAFTDPADADRFFHLAKQLAASC